jgi:histidinol-phosphate/aromatic aminotransferase/cobyric acid decarboxylase-like protein
MLKAHIVDGARWYEIDDPADLAIAETRFSEGSRHLALMQQTYGGYWRYPSMLDYCYLVNPYFPPQTLIKELSANFETLLRNYPSGDKQQSLLAGKIFGIEPDHIAVGNGAAELIAGLSEIIDGKVVVPFPTFNEYPNRFGEDRTVWMETDDDFNYTVEDVIRTADNSDAQFVLLINPENPSGHFFSKEETLKLASALKEKNKYLIFDESFIDFAEPTIRWTFLDETMLTEYPNVIVVKSISKSYGVPGLRLGILANSDNDLIRNIQKKTSIWNINSFGEYFLQIFDKYKKYYAAACDTIAAERIRFIGDLSQLPNIRVYPSQANYVLCQLTGTVTSSELAEQMLDRYNILIKDLSSKKGFNGKQFIRLAVRDEIDNTKLTTAMQYILSEYYK